MYALCLVLPNHHIPQRRSREQIEHRIRIRPLPIRPPVSTQYTAKQGKARNRTYLSLLIAAPLDPLVPLHAAIKDLARLHVIRTLKHDRVLAARVWKVNDWVRKL